MTCRCGKEVAGGHICDSCLAQLNKTLSDLPALLADLDDVITRQTGRVRYGGRSTTTPLPFHSAGSEARIVAVRHLHHWARNMGVPLRDALDQPAAVVQQLLLRATDIKASDQACDFADDIIADSQRIAWLIDSPPTRWYAGNCRMCGVTLWCDTDRGFFACGNCNTIIQVDEVRSQLLRFAEEVLVPAATLSRALSWLADVRLPAATIRSWKNREQLLPAATNHRGQPLYRVGDALDLLGPRPKDKVAHGNRM